MKPRRRSRNSTRRSPQIPQGFKNYTEAIPGSAVKIRMVAVPGGTFQMGSPESEPYRRADEGPVHQVKISPFWMERTEVTWREYEVYLLQRGNTGRNRDAPDIGQSRRRERTHSALRIARPGLGQRFAAGHHHDLLRRHEVLRVALANYRQEIPASHRGGVGIRRPRRNHFAVFLSPATLLPSPPSVG